MISPLGRATEEKPSASATEVPWTVARAWEATAAAEAPAVGTLGPAPATATGKAPAVGELGPAAVLGPAASVAPGLEVPAGAVGPWRTRGLKE